jgi:hypothetical protein
MSIDHRGAHISVPEQLLNSSDIVAVFQGVWRMSGAMYGWVEGRGGSLSVGFAIGVFLDQVFEGFRNPYNDEFGQAARWYRQTAA